LAQGFKSVISEIQTKDNLDSMECLNIFQEQKFNKEDFELHSAIDNQLGSEMKFESRD
jgi:hypothetical protein